MADMTISQGLRHLKFLKGRISEYQSRASSSVTYKESSPPAFDFSETMGKLNLVRAELIALESRLALGNATHTIEYDGQSVSLAGAVRTLQEYKGQIVWLRSLPSRSHASEVEDTYDYNEDNKRVRTQISWKCDLPERERVALVEELQGKFDLLNGLVESANHVTQI